MANDENNDNPLEEAFNEFLKERNLYQKFNEQNLLAKWNEIVGEMIAKRTTKLYVKNKTLFVKLNSAPLKHELTMGKEKILQLIEKHLQQKIVDDIRFL